MHLFARIQRQAIAQKIEPDLVGSGIGDVASVGTATVFDRHALLEISYGKPQEFVDAAHPLSVAAGQIIVHGHHMNSRGFAREPDDGRNGGQCLAFARLHLRNLSGR